MSLLEELVAALRSATTTKQQQAIVEEITSLGTDAAYDTLIHLMSDDRIEIAGAAVFGLGSLANERAVDPLIAILAGERRVPFLIDRVIVALGKLKNKRAVQPLIDTLDNMGFLYISTEMQLLRERLASQLETAEDVDLYLELLKAQQSRVYVSRPYMIVDILGDLGDLSAVEPLIKILQYRTMIPAPAIAALGKLGDVRALPILTEYLDDDSEASRWGGGPVKNIAQSAMENIKRQLG